MFCPAFGMVGTLVGLVKMMTDLTDIVQIAANMQVALLTTFWGSLIANTLFLPVAGKLQVLSNNEVVIKEMMIEGVLSIPKGENPKVLKKYLETFIAPKRRIDG
jgi:chemotaxis protein MotA